jgi:hypothetical protein
VDDDNVLATDYLVQVLEAFRRLPKVGALGGKSLPEFSERPAEWQTEFLPLLALRDLGNAEQVSSGLKSNAQEKNAYPSFAPIGAGMALRREAIVTWLEDTLGSLPDRSGKSLSSSGDNDIILFAMRQGWEVAYLPQLWLTHLIPPSRLRVLYLGALNRGIQKSWMEVLSRHDANPWPPLRVASAALRRLKAWFSYRAWSSPAAWIRWQGACGHFEGRVSRD